MAVYYRYWSGVDTFSLPVAAPSISVGDLKRLIMGTSRHGHGRTRGRGTREGIAISDSQTGEEYKDDSALVLRKSTVVVRRVAGPPVDTIVAPSTQRPKAMQNGGASSSDSSSRSSGSADLYCKICKKVMDDAVMTSKCCFSSFCDRCIRAHIVANSKCACGAQALPRRSDPQPGAAYRHLQHSRRQGQQR